MNIYFSLLASLFLGVFSIFAQEGNSSKLTISEIMQGDDFVGHLPSNVQWATDSKTIYFDWNPDGVYSDSLYAYQLATDKIAQVDIETEYDLPSPRYILNKAKTKKVYEKQGDLYMMDLVSNKTIRITNTDNREGNPHFTDNESKIAYQSDNNILTWDIDTGATTQITDFKDKEKKEEKKNAKDEWLYKDQLGLFDVLRERKENSDEREKLMKRHDLKAPLTIYTDGKSAINQKMSPDGNYVTYVLMDRSKDKGTIVPHYVTESGYTEDQNTRSKVGDEPDTFELFIYDIAKRTTRAVVFDNLEGLDYVPE